MYGCPYTVVSLGYPSVSSISISDASVSISLPQVQRQDISQPSISVEDVGSAPQAPDVSFSTFTYQFPTIEIPDLETVILDAFSPYTGEIKQPTEPAPFPEVEKPDDIDYSKFTYSYNQPTYIFYPVDYDVPELSSLDVSIPSLPEFSDIPQNSIEWLVDQDLSKLLTKTPSSFDVYGSFFDNIDYPDKDFISYLKREYNFIKSKADAYVRSLLNLKSLEIAFKNVDYYLFKEKKEFLKHLTEKQRQFFLAVYKLAIYKRRVQARVDYIKARLKQEGARFTSLFKEAQAKYELWKAGLSVNKTQFRHILSHNKRVNEIVKTIIYFDREVRRLFRDFMSLYAMVTSIESLNIERERLLYEKLVALANVDVARQEEERAKTRKELIDIIQQNYNERLNLLNATIDALYKKIGAEVNVLNSKSRRLSTEFNYRKTISSILEEKKQISTQDFLAEVQETYHRLALQYLTDYLSLVTMITETKGEESVANSRLQEIKKKLEYLSDTMVNKYNYYFNKVMSAIEVQYELENDLYDILADAKIEAQIIESFK